MASVAAQHPVRLATDCRAGVSWCEQQADLASDRQIIEIVTDEAGALGGDAEVVLQLRQCPRFVLDAHQTVLDAQLLCPDLGGATLATTEEGERETGLLQQAGLALAFLSGGQGGATEIRAQQLGIKHCLVGIKDKPRALAQLQHDLGVTPQRTGFIGDDLNDLAVRGQIGLLLTPADACAAVRRQADWVLSRNGGHGAVREAAEAILNSRGRWTSLRRHGWRDRND